VTQRLAVGALNLMDGFVTRTPEEMKEIQNIRGKVCLIPQALETRELVVLLCRIDPKPRAGMLGQEFPVLSQLDEGGSGVILKIALRQGSQHDKSGVVFLEENEIGRRLGHVGDSQVESVMSA